MFGCGAKSTHVLPLDQVTRLSGKIREGKTREVEDIQGRTVAVPRDFALRVYSKRQPDDEYQEFEGRLYIDLTEEVLEIGEKGEDEVRFRVRDVRRLEVVIHPNDPRRRTIAVFTVVGALALLALGNVVWLSYGGIR
jgi:hypothetical protein